MTETKISIDLPVLKLEDCTAKTFFKYLSQPYYLPLIMLPEEKIVIAKGYNHTHMWNDSLGELVAAKYKGGIIFYSDKNRSPNEKDYCFHYSDFIKVIKTLGDEDFSELEQEAKYLDCVDIAPFINIQEISGIIVDEEKIPYDPQLTLSLHLNSSLELIGKEISARIYSDLLQENSYLYDAIYDFAQVEYKDNNGDSQIDEIHCEYEDGVNLNYAPSQRLCETKEMIERFAPVVSKIRSVLDAEREKQEKKEREDREYYEGLFK